MSTLGVFIDKSFMARDDCQAIMQEMHEMPRKQSQVYNVKHGNQVDVTIRKTDLSKVSEQTYMRIMQTYMELKPQLEAFFNMPLLGIEVPEFLYYSAGSFFTTHHDVIDLHTNPRKISTILFLNQQEKEGQEGQYTGGELCLYGLHELFKDKGIAMPSSQGLLLAFRSEVMHEVKPILSGTRCSLVVWYH